MKRGLFIVTAVMIGAALTAPVYSQTAVSSAVSTQGETSEVRGVAILAPPAVMEQNGKLTGFSIELWNGIAAQLKLKTSYQIAPDVGALEEALRSKAADVVVSPISITSTRDRCSIFRFQ